MHVHSQTQGPPLSVLESSREGQLSVSVIMLLCSASVGRLHPPTHTHTHTELLSAINIQGMNIKGLL